MPELTPCQRCKREYEEKVERLEAEVSRLKSWLLKIDGGDRPCTDETQLRQWAYEAVTLGHDCE